MNMIFYVSVLLVLFTAHASGQTTELPQHPIDRKLSDCLSTGENQSTYGMIECIRIATEEWDKELNTEYRRLLDILPEQAKAGLKAAQKQWIVWRDKELEFSGIMHYGMDGSMWRITAASRHCDIVKQRARELTEYRQTKESE